MNGSGKNSAVAASATDITGVWKITWTDESNNTGAFEITIETGKDGSLHVVDYGQDLPLNSGFLLGNEEIQGQSVSFTIGVFMDNRAGTFNFDLPEIGGTGHFSGSASLCGGLKNTQGTCVSVKVK